MKFLNERYENRPLMLLNCYYDRGSFSESNDVLYILFKELDTGEKRLIEIESPDIEVHVLKEKYRTWPNEINFDPTYIHDWVPKEHCDTKRVNYKNMHKELARILRIPIQEVKLSPYIFGMDIGVERFYIHQFLKEYQADKIDEVTAGFYDIETDTINFDDWPEPGDAPIPVVTYIDGPGKIVYTLIYHNANIYPSHPKYDELKAKYDSAYDEFVDNLDGFIAECHKRFDSYYGSDLEYIILTFEDEAEMLKTFFKLVNACKNDYAGAWNAPFDFGNMMARLTKLGVDTASDISDGSISKPIVAFKEDRAFLPTKRKHLMFSPNLTVWTDMLVNYAAIRSQRGKLPSYKLNAICKDELGDEKLDYSEETDIKHFMYDDFIKFILYNIKDVLLLYGLESKTHDLSDVTSRIAMFGLTPQQAFASLPMEDSSMIMFMDNYTRNGCGYWPGSNRAKLNIDMNLLVEENTEDDENEIMSEEESEYDFTGVFDSDDKDDDDVKYAGAIVLSPAHMQPSGHEIFGNLKKYIHDHLIDMDIGAEYPTATILQNASNETFHGKIMFPEPLPKKVPLYRNFEFADKDEAEGYELNENTFIMEAYQQGQYGVIGEYVLGLPDIEELLNTIDSEGWDIFE